MPIRPAFGARRTRLLSGITGVCTTLVVGAILTIGGVVVPSQSASAASAMTVTAADQDPDVENAPFPDLEVTVSQTENLVSQGLELSWKGGKKSTVPNGQTGGENFLQIAQCWGDAPTDPAFPDAPAQPDRTTCQYGAFATPGATRDNSRSDSNVIPAEDAAYTAPRVGLFSPPYTSIPFRSATGKTIANVVDGKRVVNEDGSEAVIDVNSNEFFTSFTSNEVSWAGTGADGTGSAKIELQTAVQSTGLGCGTPVESADGTITGTSCWLVVIPRGSADEGEASINRSGLLWDSWKHKLAVKLDFRPVGVRCNLGAAERLVAGSELVAGAVGSWQPSLCNSEGGSVYTILTGAESDAAAAANGTATAPLALTSGPLVSEQTDTLAYAPIAVTGVAIAFAVDREPRVGSDVPQTEQDKARLPFTEMKLNPRLVAKLLTNSYIDSLPYGADRSHLGYKSASVPGKNPRNITYDPEFLAINPEWKNQALVSPSLSDMLLPQGRSDGTTALWTYVTSDAAAAAFLAGTPDEYGMIVNPYSSTDATKNPTGAALELPRDDFPKADPVEQAADGSVAPINLVSWRPYTNNLDASANLVLAGNGQVLGGWDPVSVPPKYTKTARSLPGLQRVIGVTDTASAAKYQVYTAALLNQAGVYVSPSTESLTAGAAAMTMSPRQSQVYGLDPRTTAALGATTAYPLTVPVYAAASPLMADASVRASYAAFIRYAVTDGQVPGTSPGQLPEGYAPIPAGWKSQALAAASVLETGPKAVEPTPPTTPAEATTSATTTPAVAQTTTTPTGTLDVPTAAVEPTATGEAVLALAGKATPDDRASDALQNAVPGSVLAGLLSALLVPLITRLRRKAL